MTFKVVKRTTRLDYSASDWSTPVLAVVGAGVPNIPGFKVQRAKAQRPQTRPKKS